MTRRSQDSVANDLAAALRERAADVGGEDDLYPRIMAVAAARPQPRRLAWWSASGRLPTMTVPARVVAAAVIAVLAVGILQVNRFDRSAVGGPSPTPSADPSMSAAVSQSATPTATPSPTPTPLLWTQASLKEDWPGPVRPEPAGGAIVVPLQEEADEVIPDLLGDTGSAAHPWVDIRELQGGGARIIIELGSLPPFVAPTEQWVAYGVVVDDDRDGIPDRRFGIDNIPGTAPDGYDHRAWITDLHTGRTVVAEAGNYGGVGETYFDNWYPGSAPYTRTGALFGFGGQCPGGCSQPGLVDPFYVWASVIENGRVVATDYAPDAGWLLEPASTPEVESSPSAGPTPQVEDDPDVPGGRLWTVSVLNNSPDPATLFVAEADGSGRMGPLVGTVTPSVVPAGATVKVTIALPPVDLEGWAIFVNPGPKQGGELLTRFDVPAYGEFRIQADGTSGWRSLVP